MEKQHHVMQYFPGAITYRGFTSLWDSNLEGVEQLYILKGGPGTGKSTFMQQLVTVMLEKGYQAELLWCSSDAHSLDGVIFREASLAMVDGTAPHTRDPKYPGVREMIVDMGKYWERERLLANRSQIIALTDQNKALYQEAYDQLKKARDFEKRHEALFSVRVDEVRLQAWLDDLVKGVISCNPGVKEPDRHRWLRVATPQGMTSYLEELQAEAKQCHCLLTQDRQFGSGVLEQLAKQAVGKGCAVWYGHDPYEPDWLEAIYLPQIGVLFFLETQAPAAQGSLQSGTCQIHPLEGWQKKLINRRNRMEAEFLMDAVQAARCKGQSLLAKNKEIHDQLEAYYVKAMDFITMTQEKEQLVQEFLQGGGLK